MTAVAVRAVPARDPIDAPYGPGPHDAVGAEQVYLGIMLEFGPRVEPERFLKMVGAVEPEWFYRPVHRVIYEVVCDLWSTNPHLVETHAVCHELERRAATEGATAAYGIGGGDLRKMQASATTVGVVPYYAGTMERLYYAREAESLVAAMANSPAWRTPELNGELTALFERKPRDGKPRQAVDVFDLLAEPDPDPSDHVIPGVLARGERVIVTAAEGAGKSTLLRQMAVQVAAGVHPFTLDDVPARRVLVVDCENSRTHVRAKLRPLALKVSGRLLPGALSVAVVPEGADVSDPKDAAWLRQEIEAAEPDLVVMGPIYKLISADAEGGGELAAAALMSLVDDLRGRLDCAFVLEAHVPHAAPGQKTRPSRPYGSSRWMRWPEFGVFLRCDDGHVGWLDHWRGAREDDRQWPRALQRGGAWPWTVPTDVPGQAPEMTEIEQKTLAALREARGAVLTADGVTRQLGISKRAAQIALKSLAAGVGRDEIRSAVTDNRGTTTYWIPVEVAS